jgi:hypothetical protein
MVTPRVVGHIDPVDTVVSRQGAVGVVVREEGLVNADVHGGHASYGSVTALLDS